MQNKLKIGVKLLAGTVIAVSLMGWQAANAAQVFYQGFETGTSGWFDYNGSVSQTDGTGTGVSAFEGSYFGKFGQVDSGGPYTWFDGSRNVFPGTYSASAAIYLDTSWALGEGFDYSVASYGSDGTHQRDFIFHVAKDADTGKIEIGGSNNTNFAPREDLDVLNNHLTVENSGWYIFEHLFRNDGGVLAVDLNVYSSALVLLFTETRSDGSDTIPAEVGGNGYGWFTNIDIDGGIYVDATQLNVAAVPVPAALPLFASGLALFGFLGRRKRRKAAATA